MSSDLRTFVAQGIKVHPRVAYQGLFTDDDAAQLLAADLPPLPPFRTDYHRAIAVIDWDHRLPSNALALRVYAYYSRPTYETGANAFDDRMEVIGERDKYPEFDVPDFENLPADEAYEIELGVDGTIGRSRLTSAWRRTIDPTDASIAVGLAEDSDEYRRLLETSARRPAHLGDLEAVSWTPPCESQHPHWTLDVWYLLAFDGRIGTGRSFLIDLEEKSVVNVRDFSVRTG